MYRHGLGATTFPNGDVHTGSYVNDKRQGKGVMVWRKVGRKYVGDYHNGRRHGKGEMTFPRGDKYTGDWVRGRRTGHGIYLFANGNRYQSNAIIV